MSQLEGDVVFNESSGDYDFRVESNNKTHAFFVDGGTDKVSILSGSGVTGGNGTDVNFFVSGSIDSRTTAVAGTAVFGGDMVISGTLSVNRSDAGGYSMVTITTDGKVGIGSDTPGNKLSVGGNMDLGEYLYHKNDQDTFMRFENDQITFSAGNETLFTIKEHTQDIVTVGDGGDVDFQVKTAGDNNTLFVQGSTDRVGIGLNGPATTLHVKDSNPGIRIQREANTETSTLDFAGEAGTVAASISHGASTNDLIFNVFNGSGVEEILRVGDRHGSSNNRQVIFLSGSTMHGGAMQPRKSSDIAFFVSGSIDSIGTSIKGASVFGGDLLASGSITAITGLTGSLTRLKNGTPYLRSGAGISITTGSLGEVTVSSVGSGVTRSKKNYRITNAVSAGDAVSVAASDMSTVDYDPSVIDLLLNGQMLLSGSAYDVASSAVDYTVTAATSIKFSFDIKIDDLITLTILKL